MRGNSKLPRGSFFYIQLGPVFYGGRAPVVIEVQHRPLVIHDRVRYDRFDRYDCPWVLRGYQPHKPHCQPPVVGSGRSSQPQKVAVHTGAFDNIMVDDVAKAKQFRRFKQAQTVVDELARANSMLGIHPVIHLHQGDLK